MVLITATKAGIPNKDVTVSVSEYQGAVSALELAGYVIVNIEETTANEIATYKALALTIELMPMLKELRKLWPDDVAFAGAMKDLKDAIPKIKLLK